MIHPVVTVPDNIVEVLQHYAEYLVQKAAGNEKEVISKTLDQVSIKVYGKVAEYGFAMFMGITDQFDLSDPYRKHDFVLPDGRKVDVKSGGEHPNPRYLLIPGWQMAHVKDVYALCGVDGKTVAMMGWQSGSEVVRNGYKKVFHDPKQAAWAYDAHNMNPMATLL